jgi:hypothetical protein
MKIMFKPIQCFFCGEKMIPTSPRNKHCSVKCRFKDIFRLIKPTINGCLEWPLSVGSHGYGQIAIGEDVPETAHKMSWLVHFGETNGLFVLHRCDNRLCINPHHLFLGTPQDNVTDMIIKGRQQSYEWIRTAERLPNGKLKARQ